MAQEQYYTRRLLETSSGRKQVPNGISPSSHYLIEHPEYKIAEDDGINLLTLPRASRFTNGKNFIAEHYVVEVHDLSPDGSCGKRIATIVASVGSPLGVAKPKSYIGLRIDPEHTGISADIIKDVLDKTDDLRKERTRKHIVASIGRHALKGNLLIKYFIKGGILREEFLTEQWGGGAAIYIPADEESRIRLTDSKHPDFERYYTRVATGIKSILELRSAAGMHTNTTPDFDGRMQQQYDILHRVIGDEHLIGYRCCGKSDYVASAVQGTIEAVGIDKKPKDTKITVVGAKGNLGKHIVKYLQDRGFTSISVSDPGMSEKEASALGVSLIPCEKGKINRDCFNAECVILAVNGSKLLSASEWRVAKPGTVIIGVSNDLLEAGPAGNKVASEMAASGITFIPGVIGTVGGQITTVLDKNIIPIPGCVDPDTQQYVGSVKKMLLGVNRLTARNLTQYVLTLAREKDGDLLRTIKGLVAEGPDIKAVQNGHSGGRA